MRNAWAVLAVLGLAVVLAFLLSFLAMQEGRSVQRKPFIWDAVDPVQPPATSHTIDNF